MAVIRMKYLMMNQRYRHQSADVDPLHPTTVLNHDREPQRHSLHQRPVFVADKAVKLNSIEELLKYKPSPVSRGSRMEILCEDGSQWPVPPSGRYEDLSVLRDQQITLVEESIQHAKDMAQVPVEGSTMAFKMLSASGLIATAIIALLVVLQRWGGG